MASRKVDKIRLWQRTDQVLTISKNANYTQASTSGDAITAWLYPEANWPDLTSGVDVTSGSPTGSAADTDIVLTLDTSTGITLTAPTWYVLVVDTDAGDVLLPNRVTADLILVHLHPAPA